MKEHARDQWSKSVRRRAIAIVIAVGGIAGFVAAGAKPSNETILVGPTDLPALARQSGEAMLLHETVDGNTFLYIEQNHGARLAVFDVTDPAHIKGHGSVQLDATGPFDFVSPLGDQAELVRFRQRYEDAVLDLPRAKDPQLKTVQAPTLQDPIARPGNGEFTAGSQTAEVPEGRDYQILYSASSRELDRVFDVKEVHEEMTNANTGTTFMLTESGLFVIRRPAVESIHRIMMISPN
jgi:hypothetical protein